MSFVRSAPLVGNYDSVFAGTEFEQAPLPRHIHYNSILGFCLAEAKHKRGTLPGAITKRLGLAPVEWSAIELGTAPTNQALLARICQVLGITKVALMLAVEDGEKSARDQGVTVEYSTQTPVYDMPKLEDLARILRGPQSVYARSRREAGYTR